MQTSRLAVIRARSINLGDDVQTLAALECLAAPAKILDRDRLGRVWKLRGDYRTVMNGWFMYNPRSWPPSRSVDPLFVSFHLSNRIAKLNTSKIRPQERLLAGANLEYFKHHAARGGVGTRDLATLRVFQDAGVDARFSGCLTLTLSPRGVVKTPGLCVASDLEPDALAALRQRAPNVAAVTHATPRGTSMPARLARVDELLRLYESASLVVTRRLHVALPCLALGTPVLFVHRNLSDPRFGGLIDHVRAVAHDDFLAGRYDYDFERPAANAETWRPLAENLRARVKAFAEG